MGQGISCQSFGSTSMCSPDCELIQAGICNPLAERKEAAFDPILDKDRQLVVSQVTESCGLKGIALENWIQSISRKPQRIAPLARDN